MTTFLPFRLRRYAAMGMAAAFCALTFNGCLVSKKKYDAAVTELEDLKKKQQQCLTLTNQQGNELKRLRSFADTLAYQNKELYAQRNRARYAADSLQQLLTDLRTENASLQTLYNQMKYRYDGMMKENLNKTQQISAALKAKTQELLDKERLLAERERKLRELQTIITAQDSSLNRLRELVRQALETFASDEFTVETRNGKIYISMSEKLLFEAGKAEPGLKGQRALGKLAAVLNKNPEMDILIEGHTDKDPINTDCYKDNWDLSVARATSVVKILVKDYSVDPVRITPAGRSEYLPVASNNTATGKAKNRRIEIVLSPKMEKLMKAIEK